MRGGNRPRVLVAGVQYEVNSFTAGTGTLDIFRRRRLAEGEDVFATSHGDEIEGARRVAARRGVDLVPVFLSFGGAGPVLADEVYDHMRERILAGLRREAGRLDGIYLPLHGAMATQSLFDVEGDLVARIRGIVGREMPIVATFDMHANFTRAMELGLDAAVGFKTCPHVDYPETGEAGMEILCKAMAGEARPRLVHRKIRMMTSAEGHDTNTGPMTEIIALLREAETKPGVLSATVIAPQPWMDVPELGWSILVVVDGDEALPAGRREVDRIARHAWSMRERFRSNRIPLSVAIAAIAASAGTERPFVLSDASDAPSAGSFGDSTVVLKHLLERPPLPGPLLLTLTDPEATRACHAAGIGATLALTVGAVFQPNYYEPVRVQARVLGLYEGPYLSELPPMQLDAGLRAVVEVESFIRLLLSEKPVITLDLKGYEASGLFPREAKTVIVKSAGQFRGFYAPFAQRIIELDTPGPVDSLLPRLPFRNITRPLWPFDPDLAEPWEGAGSAGCLTPL
jgi:microcystin degradation protein MlrC